MSKGVRESYRHGMLGDEMVSDVVQKNSTRLDVEKTSAS